MKSRCYNTNNTKYYLYGGKNITICKEWLENYDNFKTWSIKNGYEPNKKLSIDRINSNKNYEPNNCQWITVSENSAKANIGFHKNKTKNGRMFGISPNKETIEFTNVCEFCRHYKLGHSSVSHRLNNISKTPYKGWSFYRINEKA